MAVVRLIGVVQDQYHEVWEEGQGRERRTEEKINGLTDWLHSETYSIHAQMGPMRDHSRSTRIRARGTCERLGRILYGTRVDRKTAIIWYVIGGLLHKRMHPWRRIELSIGQRIWKGRGRE
jgi:hypothetical protein